MFGRGVISLQYGWALEQAGHNVQFFVRPGKKSLYGSQVQLDLLDARINAKGFSYSQSWHTKLIEDIPNDHHYDLIILSVQHYHFKEAAAELLPKLKNAILLVFNNFWEDPQKLTKEFPAQQLVWGFLQAGGGWADGQTLRGALLKGVHFGSFGADLSPSDVIVRKLFTQAGFKIIEHRDFKGWLYIHFAINAGLFSVAESGKEVLSMLDSKKDAKKAFENIRHGLRIVKARGIVISKNLPDYFIFLLPVFLSRRLLKTAINSSPPLRMILSSNANQQEARSYTVDVMDTARELNMYVAGYD